MKLLIISADTPGLAVEPLVSYPGKKELEYTQMRHPVAPRPGRRVSIIGNRKVWREPTQWPPELRS